MTKILLVSDTHSYIDTAIIDHAKSVDEVWHAGDVGNVDVLNEFAKICKVYAVYGNIDGADVRLQTKEFANFESGGARVLMTHIGGYPGKYYAGIKQKIVDYKPSILVCGHSHILKVISDTSNNLLFLNPGAIGKSGFHTVRTMLKFEIVDGIPKNLCVVEYERKM